MSVLCVCVCLSVQVLEPKYIKESKVQLVID